MKPKIFCFINQKYPSDSGYQVVALAEDGTPLTEHLSSMVGFAKDDIGFSTNIKNDIYERKYPNGYELVWIDRIEMETSKDFLKAMEIAQNNFNLEP